MLFKQRSKLIIGMIGLLMALMLVGGVQVSGLAASPESVEVLPNGLHSDGAGFSVYESGMPAIPAAPNACHSVSGYSSTLERTNFCVYYNSPTTAVTAGDVADVVEDYWNAYVGFGFTAPLNNTGGTEKIEVRLINTTSCNGSAWGNYIELYTGCFGSDENMMQVTGHEIFHRVQFNYDSDWNPNWPDISWFYEGTARASEDMVFDAVDNWAGAMGVGFSFNREVNEYLASTNNDLTSHARRYEAALFWKYFSEQFGAVTTEPQRGIDAILALWQNADTSDDIAAVNAAMSGLGAGMSFNEAFRKFTAANYTKDLSGLPDGSYNYIDEEQAGNPATYGPIVPTSGGTISGASPSTDWTNRTVNRYSARYYQADVGSNCPVVSASFHRDSGADVFYHVVTQNGTALGTHREGSGADWTQAFLNDGITKITAVIGGQANSGQVDIEFSCANPVVDIKLPNSVAIAHVGSFSNPKKFLAQVLVTDGSPTGPVVGGLSNNDFLVKVNGIAGTIETGGFIQEQYWLVVRAPAQSANDVYDLRVELQEPGTSTEIASDVNTDSISYDSDRHDHVIIIDRSGSMSADGKMTAAKQAARFYVDMMRVQDGISVVAYNHDVDTVNDVLDMVALTSAIRTDAKNLISGFSPSGATSIGDGLDEAVNQRAPGSSIQPNCQFVLLSDGMENSSQFWSGVRTDVINTNCPVMSVAFGADSNETLMQTIAADTGGGYYYNDVYVSALNSVDAVSPADMALELGGIYEYAQGNSEGRQRLLSEKGIISAGQTLSHTVMIDDSISEAMFTLDWVGLRIAIELSLEKPDGTKLNCAEQDDSFNDLSSGHLGCRVNIPSTDVGEWTLWVSLGGKTEVLPYQVIVSAPSDLFMQMLLPDRLGVQYFTGDFLPLVAMIAGDGAVGDATVETMVTCGNDETKVMLYDDGNHGDGLAGDGFYGNVFRRTTQASKNAPAAEEGAEILPIPNDEGSCSVKLTAGNGDFQREAMGGFSILEGEDTDPENGVPDTIDEAYGDLTADPDLDELDTHAEWGYGTDPFNSDSDGGGENDYSELLLHGSNPFDPSDDMIEAPDFLQTQAQNGSVKLLYDVKGEYVGIKYYYKKVGDSEWTLSGDELPLAGALEFPATNGETYLFAMRAYDGDDHRSAVVFSEAVTPSEDPIPPEAHVLVNSGAPSTVNRDVILSFVPYEYPQPNFTEAFDDITEMKISNDPSLEGAEWQPFLQGVPWKLSSSSNYGDVAKVYVRFKDENDNETVGVELGQIIYAPEVIMLPLVSRGAQ